MAKRILATIFILGFLLVTFQNCTLSSVDFGTTGNQGIAQQESGNGDGYLGKIPPGNYLRTHINYNCKVSAVDQNLIQGFSAVSESEILVKQDNCQDFSFPVPQDDSRVDYKPYNQDYFGLDLAFYESENSFRSSPDFASEIFCRRSDDISGLDVVIKVKSPDIATAKIYSGQKAKDIWSSQIFSDISVQKTETATELSYQGDNFSLIIGNLNSVLDVYPASFRASISGRVFDDQFNCRKMRGDSSIGYSQLGSVGFWQFNGDFADVSGNGLNIVPIDPGGLISFPAGHYNQGVALDGRTTRLRVDPTTISSNLSQISIASWIKLSSSGGASTSFGGGIMHKADAATPNAGWLFAVGAGTVRLYFTVAYSGGQHLYVTNDGSLLTSGQWNHVVVTWDGSNLAQGVRFYVNGQSTNLGTAYDAVGQRADDSNLPIYLGDISDNNTPPFYLQGQLDHVSLWDRVLTPSEVQSLYTTGSK